MTNHYTTITGASSGMGYKIALAFANRGKNLILIARREDRLNQLKDEILKIDPKLDVVIRVCDLGIQSDIYDLYQSLSDYFIETWINSAGFGDYHKIAEQDLSKIESMINLNVTALTLLSTLYTRDYQDKIGAQLINISSQGGYLIAPNCVTYCATKFYVSAFTEGLSHELKATQKPMKAKVFAPAATQTEFGQVANDVSDYDYEQRFKHFHTSDEVAELFMKLYDSNETVGSIDRQTFEFSLIPPVFNYSGDPKLNQA